MFCTIWLGYPHGQRKSLGLQFWHGVSPAKVRPDCGHRSRRCRRLPISTLPCGPRAVPLHQVPARTVVTRAQAPPQGPLRCCSRKTRRYCWALVRLRQDGAHEASPRRVSWHGAASSSSKGIVRLNGPARICRPGDASWSRGGRLFLRVPKTLVERNTDTSSCSAVHGPTPRGWPMRSANKWKWIGVPLGRNLATSSNCSNCCPVPNSMPVQRMLKMAYNYESSLCMSLAETNVAGDQEYRLAGYCL